MPIQALAIDDNNIDSILNNAPNLSKLLDHTIRPTMDEVYAAAKDDGLLNNQALIVKIETENEETISSFAKLFINLESLYPGFQLFTLGRDAVAYSDLFDALAIHSGNSQRAVRVNLSGESARHADPELLRQYLISLGMPKTKSELFANKPIVFMDYTQYDSTSQLRRLIEIFLRSLLKFDEKSEVKTKFAALTTNGQHSPIGSESVSHIGTSGEAIWSIDGKIQRATAFNGKFDSLAQKNDGSFATTPGLIEVPSLSEKKKSLFEMLSYLLLGRKIAEQINLRLFVSNQLSLLEHHLNNKNNAEQLSFKHFRLARNIIKSQNENFITQLIDIVLKSKDSNSNQALKNYIFNQLKLLLDKTNKKTIHQIAMHAFTIPDTQNMSDLLKLLIDKADQSLHYHIAKNILSLPYNQYLKDLLKYLIDKANQSTIQSLVSIYAHSPQHIQQMTDILGLIIEKADHRTLVKIANDTFSQPHTQHMTDHLKLVIEKADQIVLHSLASQTFSQPHTQHMTDLLKLVIEKADQIVLHSLATRTFSQPHTQHMTDLLKLVIEKADQFALQILASQTFSKPHTQHMTDLLKLVIEKADQVALHFLSINTFSKPHTQHMTDARWALVRRAKSLNYTDSDIQKIEQELTSSANSCEARLDI